MKKDGKASVSEQTKLQNERDEIDIKKSVKKYNEWYENEAQKIYKVVRESANGMKISNISRSIKDDNVIIDMIKENPEIIRVLRFSCNPILSPDRLVGLSEISRDSLVKTLEDGKLPKINKKYSENDFLNDLLRIVSVIRRFQGDSLSGGDQEKTIILKSEVILDRLTNAQVSSKIKNAQEPRQMRIIKDTLDGLKYTAVLNEDTNLVDLEPGQYSLRMKVAANKANQPVDVVIHVKGKEGTQVSNYIFIECKSAGDFTNVNKRRKEESEKIKDLQDKYPNDDIDFCLFIGGYFNKGYLDFERSSGIKIFWEHLPEVFKRYIIQREDS